MPFALVGLPVGQPFWLAPVQSWLCDLTILSASVFACATSIDESWSIVACFDAAELWGSIANARQFEPTLWNSYDSARLFPTSSWASVLSQQSSYISRLFRF